VGTVGPRFFGFVIGGASPAASAADLVAVGWDQCAYNEVLSPAAAAAERGAGTWLKQLLGLPETASAGFVTGAQAANTVGLAVGRHAVLADAGWDVEQDGLCGAPAVRLVAGEERHATIDRAARLLGIGLRSIEPVPADANGAIRVDALGDVLAASDGPSIVCLQTGNVNTGACDDLAAAIPLARRHGAWVHVDGAFGLWAAASPRTSHLVRGVELADSWGTDAHKWLNVPYDSGLVFCRDPALHRATMHYSAAYLTGSGATEDFVLGDLTPESSRRARGFAVWAALRELGTDGLADLVDRSCALARRMAEHLADGGATIHNDVVLNQVLVSFDDGRGDAAVTDAIIEEVQREGTCWVGGTTWHGLRLMRVSVSNATTTAEDIDVSAAAILRAAARRTET
jgi:glutamate/tyrosine decarboxylase-like PLP-dependent enzyme